MPKLKITIISREEAVIDSGDIPARVIANLLEEGDGALGQGMHSWGLSDIGNPTFTTDSIAVEEVKSTTTSKSKTKAKTE